MNHEHLQSTGNAERTALAHVWQLVCQALRVPEVTTTNPEHGSKHSIWDAGHISKRASRDGWRSLVTGADWSTELEQQSRPYLNSALWHDARHHAREYHLVETDTYYYTDVTHEGITGGGYQNELIGMTQAFTEILAKDGKNISRSNLETQVLTLVKNWAWQAASQPGRYILWTSPPDTKANGMAGIDSNKDWHRQESHHSFIYVIWAEQVTTDTVRLHTRQLRGWPNINQLISFQSSVLAEKEQFKAHTLADSWQQPSKNRATLDLIENIIEINAPTSPLEDTLTAVKTKLYATQKKWVTQPDKLPVVDQTSFWQQQEELFASHYLATVEPLLAKLSTGLTETDPYWSSSEYQQLLDELDTAFTYYDLGLKDILIETNTNPNYRAFHPNPILNLGLGWGRRLLKMFGSNLGVVDKVKKLYHLDVALRIHDVPMSRADAFWYLRNVSGLLSFGNAVLSASQCGILTPFSLPFSMAKYAGQASAGSLGLVGANPLELMPLPLRRELSKTLTETQFVEICIAGQVWTVPKEYLEETEWLTQTTLPVMGPCDIPLEDDSLAFALSLSAFERWRQFMVPLLAGSPALETVVSLLPNTQPEKVIELFNILVTKVLKPVSLGSFVSGTYDFADEVADWVDQQYLEPLKTSANPLLTLELLINQHAAAIVADTAAGNTLRERWHSLGKPTDTTLANTANKALSTTNQTPTSMTEFAPSSATTVAYAA